jgi:hypothetical protein
MLKNQPYLKLLLSFAVTAIFILASYIVIDYALTTFFTTYRWQIKALAIYNVIGGTKELWWTEKATSIMWDLLLTNSTIMGWLWTAIVSALTRIFILGKGE